MIAPRPAALVAVALLAAATLTPTVVTAEAEEAARPTVGIDERLGERVPLDLAFRDEAGETVLLRDLVSGPTALGLVYYRCPGICSPFLHGVADVVAKTPAEPGRDYRLVVVSFNPSERPAEAREKKAEILASIRRPVPPAAWRFLTGDTDAIRVLADAIGFRYIPTGADYIHTASLVVLTGDGMITRYLYGIDFLPLDLKMALVEASEGRVGPTVVKVLRYCFAAEPGGRRFVLSVTKIAGVSITIGAVALVGALSWTRRRPPEPGA